MSTGIFLSGNRGRWVRRGGSIVLLPGDGCGAGGGMEGEVPGGTTGTAPAAAYTVCDFIDPRIDVAAQYALAELAGRGGVGARAAPSILAAVKAGVLGGIYQEDQRAPALRARTLGVWWWTLIPPGSGSVCAPGVPPLISFRRSLAKDRFALGTELMRVYLTCGIPILPPLPPSGKVCTRPPVQTVPSTGGA